MKNVIVFGAMALLMVGLTTGCMRAKAERRADARAAQAERQGQDVDVNINVERNEEERRAASGVQQERARAQPGDVAATMIAPEECPMVEGSQVALIDLGDGAALEFVAADADDVQIVRDRVLNIAVKHQRAMQERLSMAEPHATMSGEEHQRGEGHEGGQAHEGMRQQAEMEASINPMPPSHVAVVDVDRGSRIIFVPVDRSDLDQLNDALEQRAEFMAEGSCPANLMSMRVPESEIPG